MRYYPVFLDLKGKSCLVVGGGAVAERKIRSLLAAGAKVICLSTAFTPVISELARKKKITIRKIKIAKPGAFKTPLRNIFLVIAATSSSQVNTAIFKACRSRNVLVNAVDDARHCDFIAPAVVTRGLLSIAVSTGGASPLLAKKIRKRIGKLLGPEYGRFLRFMSRHRQKIYRAVNDPEKRKKVFEKLTGMKFINLFKRARPEIIKKKFKAVLKTAE